MIFYSFWPEDFVIYFNQCFVNCETFMILSEIFQFNTLFFKLNLKDIHSGNTSMAMDSWLN